MFPRNTSMKSNTFKAFCVFCKNAGKSEREYTSHYPKTAPGPTGKVICPTILSTECNYCHTIGHAKNHCPKLLSRRSGSKNKYTKANIRPNQTLIIRVSQKRNAVPGPSPKKYIYKKQKQTQTKSTGPKLKNRYSILNECDEIKRNNDINNIPKVYTSIKQLNGVWGKTMSVNVKTNKPFKKQEHGGDLCNTMEEESKNVYLDCEDIEDDGMYSDDNEITQSHKVFEFLKECNNKPKITSWADALSDSDDDDY